VILSPFLFSCDMDDFVTCRQDVIGRVSLSGKWGQGQLGILITKTVQAKSASFEALFPSNEYVPNEEIYPAA